MVSPEQSSPPSLIQTAHGSFRDHLDRELLLRGVNLGGVCKFPIAQGSHVQQIPQSYSLSDNAAKKGYFVGRPLDLTPLDGGSGLSQADIDLARLRGWGFNVLRFPFTWEAIEGAGPGIHDDVFMDYVVEALKKCAEYGFKVFMDPHQDTWSRYSGGSGAPYWTLHACGINPDTISSTTSAVVHSEYTSPQDPSPHPEPNPATFPSMIWSTNYGKLLCYTVWTLFFAGRDFAPKCIMNGVNIQDYLQKHFIDSVAALAQHIASRAPELLDETVIGWDSLNEPSEGLIGWVDLAVLPTKQGNTLKKGSTPTPLQGMHLGMGQEETVDYWDFGTFGPAKTGTVTINPKGQILWADKETLEEDPSGKSLKWGWTRDPGWKVGTCIWALHGVWDIETGFLLRPDYFNIHQIRSPEEQGVDPDRVESESFMVDYWLPHFTGYTTSIRSHHPNSIIFVQPPVFALPPPVSEDILQGRACYSAHYYDGLTLVTKHWNWFNADALGLLRGKYGDGAGAALKAVRVGEGAIRNSLRDQLGYLKDDALIISTDADGSAQYPMLIGEIGTPMDMDGKLAYYGKGKNRSGRGDYSKQETALDASLNGADGANCLNWTVWTYNPGGSVLATGEEEEYDPDDEAIGNSHQWGDGWNGEDLGLWCEDDTRSSFALPSSRAQRAAQKDIYNLAGDSSGSLLKNKGVRVQVELAETSTSTLRLPLAPEQRKNARRLRDIRRAKDLQRWQQNPYDFLTDGARAVRAFSRPWPIATVGRVVGMDFDLKSATLKLSVAVPLSAGSEAPTEIFLPVVHYGKQEFVDTLKSSLADLRMNGSTTDLNNPFEDASSTSSRDSKSLASVDIIKGRPAALDLVQVDVKASSGRWEVEGQVLRWFYGSSDGSTTSWLAPTIKPDPGQRILTIEIRRRGGAIRPTPLRSPASTTEEDDDWCPILTGSKEGGCVVA